MSRFLGRRYDARVVTNGQVSGGNTASNVLPKSMFYDYITVSLPRIVPLPTETRLIVNFIVSWGGTWILATKKTGVQYYP